MTRSNGENLPAVVAGVLPEPADLDGWSIEDHVRAHEGLAGSFAQQRLSAGVLLWNARRLLGDGAYGEHVETVAALYQVTPRSLRSWRVAAEVERGLQITDARSIARTPVRKLASTPERTVRQKPEVVKPDEVIPPRPVSKPAAVQQRLPGSARWGLLDSPLPDRPPLNADEAAAAKRFARSVLDWAAQEPTVPKQPAKSGRAPSRDVQPIVKSKHGA